MFKKFMLWILNEAYGYHRVRLERYKDKCWDLMAAGRAFEEERCFNRYSYHDLRCRKIDELIYALD